MAKKPIKPLIRALAELIADDVIATHDTKLRLEAELGKKLRKRRQLPREFWEKEFAKEDPLIERGVKNVRKSKGGTK